LGTVGDYIKLDKRVGHVAPGTYTIKISVAGTGKYAPGVKGMPR